MSLSLLEHVRRAGIPAVGVVGDEWLRWGQRADAWSRLFRRRPRLARLVERRTGLPASVDLSGSALWLFNSEAVRRGALQSNLGLQRTGVAHPGIDETLFAEPAPERDWDWSFLYLGRLDPRKGVHIAIEALKYLPGEARLVLQGEGDEGYAQELRDLTGRLGLGDRVTFSTAPRSAIPAVYTAADAVLFPVQWQEPWGLVPLEAMAMGRPVIATGTGGSAEYLKDGMNCLLFEPRDSPQALAAAIGRLAADPALRMRLRDEGRRTASGFTETAYNEEIRMALKETAGGSLVGAHG
jgi:glycosyltransferase involved in cell wall biosynthesis